ncbi:MAG: hypothetical protein JRJ29_03540 [Deltaproteobacteria bacterium]|nr:hypothetical protein [Deltaproteobacteria bacterium]
MSRMIKQEKITGRRREDAEPGSTREALVLPTFLPIVTTYSVTSEETPLATLMNDSRALSLAFLHYQERMGFDCLPIMEESTFTAEAFGCKIEFKTHEAYVVEHLANGSLEEAARVSVPDLAACQRIRLILESVEYLSAFSTLRRPLVVNSTAPLSSASKIIGIENLLKDMIKAPEMVTVLLDKVTEFIITFSHSLIKAGARIIFVGEPVGSPDLISPRLFKELVKPRLKKLFESIDAVTILHICGDVSPILLDMVETGPSILSVDHYVDLRYAREMVDHGVILGGNLDPGVTIFQGSPGQIEKAARMCCMEGGPEDFVLMPGCTIVPGTPPENIRAMIRVARELLEPLAYYPSI